MLPSARWEKISDDVATILFDTSHGGEITMNAQSSRLYSTVYDCYHRKCYLCGGCNNNKETVLRLIQDAVLDGVRLARSRASLVHATDARVYAITKSVGGGLRILAGELPGQLQSFERALRAELGRWDDVLRYREAASLRTIATITHIVRSLFTKSGVTRRDAGLTAMAELCGAVLELQRASGGEYPTERILEAVAIAVEGIELDEACAIWTLDDSDAFFDRAQSLEACLRNAVVDIADMESASKAAHTASDVVKRLWYLPGAGGCCAAKEHFDSGAVPPDDGASS